MDRGTGGTAMLIARPVRELDDHALVAEVRRGSDEAFEALYDRYLRRITAYVKGMVYDHGRAEDVSQEIFMSALRRMRETERPIAFKPWIYEIARNACIDQHRRSKRTEVVSFDADQGLGSSDHLHLVAAEPTPDAAVDTKQQLDHLCGAFGGLTPSHEILVLRELEGMSYREIGDRMSLSRPAVESTLFRARRRLTEEYQDLASGRRCERVQAIIGAAAEGMLGARPSSLVPACLLLSRLPAPCPPPRCAGCEARSRRPCPGCGAAAHPSLSARWESRTREHRRQLVEPGIEHPGAMGGRRGGGGRADDGGVGQVGRDPRHDGRAWRGRRREQPQRRDHRAHARRARSRGPRRRAPAPPSRRAPNLPVSRTQPGHRVRVGRGRRIRHLGAGIRLPACGATRGASGSAGRSRRSRTGAGSRPERHRGTEHRGSRCARAGPWRGAPVAVQRAGAPSLRSHRSVDPRLHANR